MVGSGYSLTWSGTDFMKRCRRLHLDDIPLFLPRLRERVYVDSKTGEVRKEYMKPKITL